MKNKDETRDGIKAVEKALKHRRRAIFTTRDLQQIVIDNIRDVGENQRVLIRSQILKYLWDKEKIKKITFEFPARKETRYLFGDVTNFELAESLKPDAYIAHRAAMFLNGLCDEHPRTVHINVEQSQFHKRNTNSLSQVAIDQAFKNKSRVSNEIAEANGVEVCVTHGQKTNRLGVERKKGPNGEYLNVTNIERTLIDITVRPAYSGGPTEVIKAYRRAAERVSLSKLFKMLKEMNFVYPFHQSVGFYLDASNAYVKTEIKLFEELEREFDFYLDYRMKKPAYSKKWRIHYPEDLISASSSLQSFLSSLGTEN